MLYQINLVKDRVVPRNLTVKRMAIVGSEVGFFLIVTLVIAFIGMRKSTEIRTQQQLLEQTKERLQQIQGAYDDAVKAESDREQAQRKKASLARLWNAPINPAALFEIMASLSCEGGEGIAADQLVVRKVEFGIGNNPCSVAITVELAKVDTLDDLRKLVKTKLGDPAAGAPPNDMCVRAGLLPPVVEEMGQIFWDEKFGGAARERVRPATGTFAVLKFEPAATYFYDWLYPKPVDPKKKP